MILNLRLSLSGIFILLYGVIFLTANSCSYLTFQADEKSQDYPDTQDYYSLQTGSEKPLDATGGQTEKITQAAQEALAAIESELLSDYGYENLLEKQKLEDTKKLLRELEILRNNRIEGDRQVKICATDRVRYAYNLQQLSRDYLQEYYIHRTPAVLYFSWYALEDSNFVLDRVKYCSDKSNRHYYAMKNIKEQNSRLEKIIAINNRGEPYSSMQELFLADYYRIFPRDLR